MASAGRRRSRGLTARRSRREAGRDQQAEGLGPMADGMLADGIHLAEGLAAALGQEDRVVAEAALAARRPDEAPVDMALEALDMAVGPGERERADEMGAPVGVMA